MSGTSVALPVPPRPKAAPWAAVAVVVVLIVWSARGTQVDIGTLLSREALGQMAAYAVKLVRATRPGSDEAPDFVKKYLTWGAGPRACQALLLGGKAHALLDGRVHVSTEDIRYVARPVLRHRLATSFRAESDGVSADHIVEKLFQQIREPMDR